MNNTLQDTEQTYRSNQIFSENFTDNFFYGFATANLPFTRDYEKMSLVEVGVSGRTCINGLSISESVKKTAIGAARSLSSQLRAKINELAELEPNWDGEQATQVKPHILADVVETLRRLNQEIDRFKEPFLAPTFDGFVQMEWREGKRSLEIEAVEKGWSAVGTIAGCDGQPQYYSANFERNDFVQIKNYYQWLSGDELIWPSL